MRAAGTVVLLAALAGCTVGGDGEERDDSGPTPPTSTPESHLLSETEACAEVRAGIDAFNENDLDETVRHFKAALPLAEELVAAGEDADTLLEAIDYYAALPPGEYREASPSPDFQRNKAITLTLCAYGASEPESSDTQAPA